MALFGRDPAALRKKAISSIQASVQNCAINAIGMSFEQWLNVPKLGSPILNDASYAALNREAGGYYLATVYRGRRDPIAPKAPRGGHEEAMRLVMEVVDGWPSYSPTSLSALRMEKALLSKLTQWKSWEEYKESVRIYSAVMLHGLTGVAKVLSPLPQQLADDLKDSTTGSDKSENSEIAAADKRARRQIRVRNETITGIVAFHRAWYGVAQDSRAAWADVVESIRPMWNLALSVGWMEIEKNVAKL